MKERKYKRNYRVVETLDEKTGRERRSAEYVGAYFRLPEGALPFRRRALALLPLLLAYWAFTGAYLKTAVPRGASCTP